MFAIILIKKKKQISQGDKKWKQDVLDPGLNPHVTQYYVHYYEMVMRTSQKKLNFQLVVFFHAKILILYNLRNNSSIVHQQRQTQRGNAADKGLFCSCFLGFKT